MNEQRAHLSYDGSAVDVVTSAVTIGGGGGEGVVSGDSTSCLKSCNII